MLVTREVFEGNKRVYVNSLLNCHVSLELLKWGSPLGGPIYFMPKGWLNEVLGSLNGSTLGLQYAEVVAFWLTTSVRFYQVIYIYDPPPVFANKMPMLLPYIMANLTLIL